MKLALAGYVIVSQLLASHPLHGVLVQYDRQIATLESTQRLAGLRDPASSAQNGAAAVRQAASLGATQAQRNGVRNESADRARESAALDAAERSTQGANAAAARYTAQLTTATNANLQSFGNAMATRTQRAYSARAQQLKEDELSLALDVARRDAQQRFMLRLKLNELHLTPSERARLQAQLHALDAAEAQAVGAMRRADAAQLATYREQLQHDAAASTDTMNAQLRTKAGVNYAILQRVFNEGADALGPMPMNSQIAVLRTSYTPSATARQIADGLRAAGADLAQRFARSAGVDAQSQREVAVQLRTLQADRAALYRSMLAQIRTETQAEAQQRRVTSISFVERATPGVNLTPAVRSRLARDW
jgi:hypothetical protein